MSYVVSIFKVVAIICVAVALCGGTQTQAWAGGDAYSLSVLKVKDFAKWKVGFDASAKMRKVTGENTFRIFVTADDPNKILLLVGWKSAEAAQQVIKSDKLKELREKAGVLDYKDYLIKQVDKGSL